jgi:hypothetical protein
VACICYYRDNFALISDHLFDSVCLYLLEHFDEAVKAGAGGPGKEKFLNQDTLSAGSGHVIEDFGNYLHDVAYFVRRLAERQADQDAIEELNMLC